jgi:hypothetical protein
MDPKKGNARSVPELCLSSRDFFAEMVQEALRSRHIKTYPAVAGYLVDLLNSYLTTDKLFDEEDESGRKRRETLAEMFLKAGNADYRMRIELLKKLGDTSLYVSGYFGDSLQRQIVDIDYYVEMGGTAYSSLAEVVREDTHARVFHEFGKRFLEFVDALTYIRQKTNHNTENNLLRLFDVYDQTGSKLAQEEILKKGIITYPAEALGNSRKSRPQ